MELTLATPVTIPGPTVHTYRLVATHYDYASNGITISFARLDANEAVIDTKADTLTADQVSAFMATPSSSGQTMQQLFVVASFNYITATYGAATLSQM